MAAAAARKMAGLWLVRGGIDVECGVLLNAILFVLCLL